MGVSVDVLIEEEADDGVDIEADGGADDDVEGIVDEEADEEVEGIEEPFDEESWFPFMRSLTVVVIGLI